MKRLSLLALLLLLLSQSALADYNYSIAITVTNSGSAQADFIAFATIDNSTLATNAYIDSDGLNTEVLEGGTARAYLPRDSKLGIYVPSLAANESRVFTYYLGYTPAQTDFYFMAGGNGYVSTVDDGSLEPGANDFEVEWKGYYDATKTGALLSKGGEYGIVSTTAGTVRGFVGAGSSTYLEIIPNGAGNYNQWSIVGAATAWEALDDPIGAPDDASTYVTTNGQSYKTSVALASPASSLAGADITSVVVYWRAWTDTGVDTTARVFLRLDGTDSFGSNQIITSGGGWQNFNHTVTRPGGGGWGAGDIENLEVGIDKVTTTQAASLTQIYVRVNYTAPATGVSAVTASGAHTFKITKTSTTLELFVDDVSKGTTSVGAPSDLNSPVSSSHNGPATYTEYSQISVTGTGAVLWYQPITMPTSTLTDRTETGNTGTITWGDDVPTDVTVSDIASAVSSTQPSAAEAARSEVEVVTVLEEPASMYQGEEPTNVFLYPLWQMLGEESQTNTFWIVVPLLVAIAMGLGLLVGKLTGQLWLVMVVIGIVLAAGVPMGVVDLWVPVIFFILGGAIVMIKSWVFQ